VYSYWNQGGLQNVVQVRGSSARWLQRQGLEPSRAELDAGTSADVLTR
jgi:hypothetical protein